MSIDDSELREYTHGLFGSMAGILKQDFQPFLATCVAAALASCEQVSQQHLLACLASLTHMHSNKQTIVMCITKHLITLYRNACNESEDRTLTVHHCVHVL